MYGLLSQSHRPDRFKNQSRDAKYHIDFARYCIYNGFTMQHAAHVNQYEENMRFYKNDQWFYDEDLETFFLDESGQERNRIKVIKNFIRPVVEQFRGNAAIMDIYARAEALSYKAINRREEKLSELLFLTDEAAGANPEYSQFLQETQGIGRNQSETEQIFMNEFTDTYVESINGLLTYVAHECSFKKKQKTLGLHLACAGKGTLKYDFYNGEMRWISKSPKEHYWDRSGIEEDLSDTEFQGDVEFLTASAIFEKYPNMADNIKKAIEEHTINSGNHSRYSFTNHRYSYAALGNRIPVYHNYWQDFEKTEYGYVMDEFGYPYFTRINHTIEGEDKPRYTDEDLIPVKELSEQQKERCKGGNKTEIIVDIVRYADIIPAEIIPVGVNQGNKTDALLDYGIMSYQDTEYEKYSNVKFPYKSSCWVYYEGECDAPITALINPQRMINRYSSVMENQINNAHGKSMFYDSSLVDPKLGEDGLLRNYYQNKPIGMKTRGLGIHNAVGEAGSTIDNGIMAYLELERTMKLDMESITGVNEELKGESRDPDQLVGVTQMRIQRASLIQEPFYDALADIYMQAYQAIANVGKRFYSKNDRKLVIMLGDNKAKVIQLTAEYNLEDFRVFIQRETSEDQQISNGNQLLFILRENQLLSDEYFADLYDRSTPAQVSLALRKYTREASIARARMGDKAARQEEVMVEQDSIDRQQAQENFETDQLGKVTQKEVAAGGQVDSAIVKAASSNTPRPTTGNQ